MGSSGIERGAGSLELDVVHRLQICNYIYVYCVEEAWRFPVLRSRASQLLNGQVV